jgi:DNA-binding NarL/FixJ family response regulator
MAKRRFRVGDAAGGVRVLVASADPSVRAWATDSLPADVTLCALADDGSVVAELARARRAHLCLLDLHLPGGALPALNALVEVARGTRIVVLAASDDEPGLVEAVEAGATGCIVGRPDRDALARALADVMAGQPTLPRAVIARLVAQLRLA